MLDIKFIREHKDLVKEAARKKRIQINLDRILSLDEERRKLIQESEGLKAEQNTESGRVVSITDETEKKTLISRLKIIKDQISASQKNLQKIEDELKVLALQVPNIPDPSVPEGESDADNKEIRKWGELPQFDFAPKNHIDLMKDLDLVDLERGSKTAGFRGYFLKNEAANLCFAIWHFVVSELTKAGFVPVIAPSLVKEDGFVGTGWLPQGKDEIYSVNEEMYLSGTAEVPMMNYYSGEILNEDELPKKFVAFSPCFRSEAGSYGKDTKGIYRLHEFMKVEQVVLCKADHQESVKWHEEITSNSERIMRALGIPYRVVLNCGADLGLGQVKKYDIEGWVPSENRYRETHSASYFHDFQTRRLNIRYRGNDGKIYFAHSLNNTAVATPRILISLLENRQQKNGDVAVPEVLRQYMAKDVISRRENGL